MTNEQRIEESEFGKRLDALLEGTPMDEIFVHCLAAACVAARELGYSTARVERTVGGLMESTVVTVATGDAGPGR